MRMAVLSTEKDFSGVVPALFAEGAHLLIVEGEGMLLLCAQTRGHGGDRALAQTVLDWDCEFLVCGPLEKEPFDLLANSGITRYMGADLPILEALAAAVENRLDYIRDEIGGTHAGGQHGHNSHRH